MVPSRRRYFVAFPNHEGRLCYPPKPRIRWATSVLSTEAKSPRQEAKGTLPSVVEFKNGECCSTPSLHLHGVHSDLFTLHF